MIYRKGPDWICVAANGGSIIIEKVMYKNKNILKELKTGNRLFTPTKYCEAKKKRVFYNTEGLKTQISISKQLIKTFLILNFSRDIFFKW